MVTRTHTRTHIRTPHAHIHTRTTSTHAHARTRTHAHAHTYTHSCTHTQTHTHVHTHTHTHARTHAHTHAHTHAAMHCTHLPCASACGRNGVRGHGKGHEGRRTRRQAPGWPPRPQGLHARPRRPPAPPSRLESTGVLPRVRRHDGRGGGPVRVPPPAAAAVHGAAWLLRGRGQGQGVHGRQAGCAGRGAHAHGGQP